MMKQRLEPVFSSYRGERGELIPILQAVQGKLGYLPEEAIAEIAGFLRLSESEVFGVATFYAQFKFSPTGKNVITICRGTACHVRGSARLLHDVKNSLGIDPGETTPDLQFTLQTVACFGSCALAPVVVANGKVQGRMNRSRLLKIIEDLKKEKGKAKPKNKKSH